MRRYWTTCEVRRLRHLYSHTPNREIGNAFGRTETAIMLMASKLGLRKSSEFMASPAVRWQPGNRPWNAGRKGWQAGGRARLTQFAKGHYGPRQRPVGSERRTRDGIEVKIAEPNVWHPKARYVWEQHFGPIPHGAVVRLKDGNHKNCKPENLQVVTRAEHLRLNWKPRGPVSRRISWTAPIQFPARHLDD